MRFCNQPDISVELQVLEELQAIHPVLVPDDIIVVGDTFVGKSLYGDAAQWVPADCDGDCSENTEHGGPYVCFESCVNVHQARARCCDHLPRYRAVSLFLEEHADEYEQATIWDWRQGFSMSAGGFLRRIDRFGLITAQF